MRKTVSFIVLLFISFTVGCCSTTQTEINTNTTTIVAESPKGTLQIETGLVYKSGDVKPIARNEFILLDDDAEKILQNAKVERKGKFNIKNFSILATYSVALRCINNKLDTCQAVNESIDLITKVNDALKSHIVGKVTTGFDGKGEISNINYGDYYLMGTYTNDDTSIQWNEPIKINAEITKLIIDQNNSYRK